MLAVATMSVNAMSPSSDSSSIPLGQCVEYYNEPTFDYENGARFCMFAIDRYVYDHQNDGNDSWISTMLIWKSVLKEAYDSKDKESMVNLCMVIEYCFQDAISNALDELAK